jgi:hypothetical protein
MRFREYEVRCQECKLKSISSRAIDTDGSTRTDGLECTHIGHYSAAGAGAPRGNVTVVSSADKTFSVSDVLRYERPVRFNPTVARRDSETATGFAVRAYLNAAYGHTGRVACP